MEYDIVYARVGDRELHMKLGLPDKQPDDRLPVIIWIHGGGWLGGSYAENRAAQFVGSGYAAASVQYHFSTEAIFPAQIHDCKAAVRFLRAHASNYHLDPNRIGVWGGSAGGHLAALLGTSGGVRELEGDLGNPGESSRVQAVCEYFGPAKFLPEGDEPEPVRQIPETVTQLFGGTKEEKPELYRLGSPFAHISADNPPFLIVHGDADDLVPLGQSELFRDALRDTGVEARLITVRNGNHGFGLPDQKPSNDEILREVLDFFNSYLRP